MNSAHLHLLTVHVPIVLSPLALVFLLAASRRRRGAGTDPGADEMERIAHWLVVAAAAAGAISFFSGPGALEIVKDELTRPEIAELHAAFGRAAFFLLALVAVGSAQRLVRASGWSPPQRVRRWFTVPEEVGRETAGKPNSTRSTVRLAREGRSRRSNGTGDPAPSDRFRLAVTVGLALACALLFWSGYLGGTLRHPEIG